MTDANLNPNLGLNLNPLRSAPQAEVADSLANSLSAIGRERQGEGADQWVLARRGPRNQLDPRRPYAFLLEEELSEACEVVNIATIFLTNRECPWRCLMCDLWKNTLSESLPVGAIPEQIDFALASLSPTGGEGQGEGAMIRQIKLYNSGSFFDRAAIPIEDYPAIAQRVCTFERIIVESHPALINDRVLQFRDYLSLSPTGGEGRGEGAQLEVAMGLETVHPETLARLNKRMTLDQFAAAAEFLRKHQIALRVFILVKPPFQTDDQALEWCQRSVEFAVNCGATAVSLIPTRLGNGALEALAQAGQFSPPSLTLFENAVEQALSSVENASRIFADLWDLQKFSSCPSCFPARRDRLRRMNLCQKLEPRVDCDICNFKL